MLLIRECSIYFTQANLDCLDASRSLWDHLCSRCRTMEMPSLTKYFEAQPQKYFAIQPSVILMWRKKCNVLFECYFVAPFFLRLPYCRFIGMALSRVKDIWTKSSYLENQGASWSGVEWSGVIFFGTHVARVWYQVGIDLVILGWGVLFQASSKMNWSQMQNGL